MDAILRGFPDYLPQSSQYFVNTWTMAACDNNNNNNNNSTFNTLGTRVSVLPAVSGVSSYVSGVSPPLSGVSPYVSGVSPSLSGVSPPLSGVSPPLSGVSPYMSSVSPACTPSVLPIGLFNGETLSRNQERKGTKRTRKRPLKQIPVKRFAPSRPEESSSIQAPASDGFEPRTAATTNLPLNFNTISHFNENEVANAGSDVINLTHETANMRCDVTSSMVTSRHTDSSRSNDNSCFIQNEMLELHPLTNFGAQQNMLENMQTELPEKNNIPSLGSLAKFCVDSLDLTSLPEPGLGLGETKNTPETPNPPNLTTLELTELVEFLADDLGPTGNGTTSLQQTDLQVKSQLPETTSSTYTSSDKLVNPVASSRSGSYSKVPESLNSINRSGSYSKVPESLNSINRSGSYSKVPESLNSINRGNIRIMQRKLNHDSMFGLTDQQLPELQDVHGVTVESSSASRHQTSPGVRQSGMGTTQESDLRVLGGAAANSRLPPDQVASRLVHNDVKSSLKKKLDYNLHGAASQILPLAPKDNVAQSLTALPQTSYTAISQTAHNPISQTAHNPISQTAHNPISQTSHNPISQTAHNPISHSSHNPISHTAHNPISQTAHNPISQTAHNPISHSSHNPISHTAHNPISQTSHSSVPHTKAIGSSFSHYDTALISHSKVPHVTNGTMPHVTNMFHATNGTMPHTINGTMPHVNKGTMPDIINNTVHHNFKTKMLHTTPAPHIPHSTHPQSPSTTLAQFTHTSPLYPDVLSTGSRLPSSAPTRGLQTSSPLRFSSRDGKNMPRPRNKVTCPQPHAHTPGHLNVHTNMHSQSPHNNMPWSQQPHTLMHQQPNTHTHPHTTTQRPHSLSPNTSHTLIPLPQHTSNTTRQIQRFPTHTSPHQPRVLHPHKPTHETPHLPTTQTPRQTPYASHQQYTPHLFITETPYTTPVTTTPTTTHATTQHTFNHNTTNYNHQQQPTHPPSVPNLTQTPTPHTPSPYSCNSLKPQSETPPPITPPNNYQNTPLVISNEPTQPEIVLSIPDELPPSSNLTSLTLDTQFSLPSLTFDDLDTNINVFEKKRILV